jgi:hypothetical protein
MYTNDSVNFQVAQNKRRDMLAEGERARLGRQACSLTRQSQPRPSRRSRRRLVRQLRPQAQS